MYTTSSTFRQYSLKRYAYAFEVVRRLGSNRHLDFGCYDGEWLASLHSLGDVELHGVDVDADAVARGRELHPRLLLHQIIDSSELPYPDGYFDTVSILDVLEHLDVSTQLAALEELRRALRRGGHLIVTVPGQHIFSFLDLGNLKFRFPRVHRFFYTRVHGDAAYRYRYVENPYGLIGDVAATKAWHEHFSGQRLRALVEPTGFTLVNLDGSGFFERPLLALRTAIPWQAARSVLDAIREWDARAFQSCNLFATFRKTE